MPDFGSQAAIELLERIRAEVSALGDRAETAIARGSDVIAAAILHGATMQAAARDRTTAALERQTDVFAGATTGRATAIDRQTAALDRQTAKLEEITRIIERWGFGGPNGREPESGD